MKEFTCTVQDPNGLHARPAGKLTALAKVFSASITVSANGRTADCKRLLSVMGLGAVHGTELHFKVEGEDEAEAAERLAQFCTQKTEGDSGNDG